MPTLALCGEFVFEGQAVRLVRNGELWWVLADVCQVLEISNPSDTAKRLDKDEIDNTYITDSSGRQQEMLIVNEPGYYKLIQTSRKPVAKRFDRFIRHEVLPSIRKTGSYSLPSVKPSAIAEMAVLSDLFDEKLQPIKQEQATQSAKLSRLEKICESTDGKVAYLAEKGRRDPSAETERQHGIVIRHHYFGLCPCGDRECRTVIMDDDGFIGNGVTEYHHQYNRYDNRPTATIPLARECHLRITRDNDARERFSPAFTQFQNLLARLPMKEPRIPGL